MPKQGYRKSSVIILPRLQQMISFGFISKSTVLNKSKHFQEHRVTSSDVLICLINSLLTCRYSISDIKLRQSVNCPTSRVRIREYLRFWSINHFKIEYWQYFISSSNPCEDIPSQSFFVVVICSNCWTPKADKAQFHEFILVVSTSISA